MIGEIIFWTVAVAVLVVSSGPILGNLTEWAKAGFFTPLRVHVLGIALFAGFAFHSMQIFNRIDPISWKAGLGIYVFYACFGSHAAREMERCEKRAACGRNKKTALLLLSAELRPYKSHSRDELVGILWDIFEKDVTSSTGQRYHLEVQVVPSSYQWNGGSGPMFKAWTKSVERGGDIKVMGRLTELDRKMGLYHPKSCLSFQLSGEGETFADQTEP